MQPRTASAGKHGDELEAQPDGREAEDHAAAGVQRDGHQVAAPDQLHRFQAERGKRGEPAKQAGEQEQARVRTEQLVALGGPATRPTTRQPRTLTVNVPSGKCCCTVMCRTRPPSV